MTLNLNGKKELIYKVIIAIASILIGYGINSIFVAGKTIQKVETLQTEMKDFKERDFNELKNIVWENSKQISALIESNKQIQGNVDMLIKNEINKKSVTR